MGKFSEKLTGRGGNGGQQGPIFSHFSIFKVLNMPVFIFIDQFKWNEYISDMLICLTIKHTSLPFYCHWLCGLALSQSVNYYNAECIIVLQINDI